MPNGEQQSNDNNTQQQGATKDPSKALKERTKKEYTSKREALFTKLHDAQKIVGNILNELRSLNEEEESAFENLEATKSLLGAIT